MVVFHPPSTHSMNLAVRFQAGPVPFLLSSAEQYPWEDLTLEHPQLLVLGPHDTSNMPQLEAVAQPTTGHWMSCSASARRADNLQTQWDTYSNVLSNPFCQQRLILGKLPVNKRGRLGFLLHFSKRNHIICHGCWSPDTYSQVKTTDLWVCLS